MSGYNVGLKDYLVSGFSQGFRLNNFEFTPATQVKNLKSAYEHPDIVIDKLSKEIYTGRLAGPFNEPPFSNFVVSPIGLQPKKTPNEFRLIHHLSHPKGKSINDGIPPEFYKVQYASVSQAVDLISSLGSSCFLAKSDIKSAFKIIPIHPSDYKLTGIVWNNHYYFDKTLPQGCSSSCSIFESFSTALEWIVLKHNQGVNVLHILDDFLFIAPSFNLCDSALNSFKLICDDLAYEKTVGPSTCLSFAGIELDTIEMCARLPLDKIECMKATITNFLQRKTVKLRELQSLTGLLNFACTIILPGRAFLRRLYDLMIGITKSYYHIKLTKEVKDDLRTWQQFLGHYNGKSMFLETIWLTSEHIELYTDASTSIGFGALLGKNWTQGRWHSDLSDLHITILELYPIYLAIELWGDFLQNKSLLIFSDNIAVTVTHRNKIYEK